GERRPVKQLQYPKVGVELNQRGHRRMAETGVSLTGDGAEFGRRDGVSGESLQYPGRGLRERDASYRFDLARCQMRLSPGQVQASIARQTGEQRILKAQFGRVASG